MDTFKEVVSLLGAVVGLITALIPLWGYLRDRNRRGGRPTEPRAEPAHADFDPWQHPEPANADFDPWTPHAATARPEPAPRRPVPSDSAAIERVRMIVRGPATLMLVMASLGLALNLLVAGYGYIDTFVTPLSDRPVYHSEADRNLSDRNVAILGCVALLGFSVASGVSIWSAYQMLNLRSYWAAVAGSVAMMPATLVCCPLGLASGIWSLVVLFRPEVQSAFR